MIGSRSEGGGGRIRKATKFFEEFARPRSAITGDRQFPVVFAIIIPADYFPILVSSLAFVFRGVAFEFRFREEKKSADRFLCGSRAYQQIWIRGDIRAGRTEIQRNAMMLRIMREVAQIAVVKEESIWIYLCNLAPTDMVEYGHVLPQPGSEADWYDRLPKPLQKY